jgi:hypothetical protein
MTKSVKVHAFSLATAAAIAFVLCAIYDLAFPPYGLLTAMKPISPLPLSGSPVGFVTGLIFFTIAGLLLGGLYGVAGEFWNKRLR